MLLPFKEPGQIYSIFLFIGSIAMVREKFQIEKSVIFARIMVVNQIGNCLIYMYQGQITSRLVVQILLDI